MIASFPLPASKRESAVDVVSFALLMILFLVLSASRLNVANRMMIAFKISFFIIIDVLLYRRGGNGLNTAYNVKKQKNVKFYGFL